eukprot:TRINITY_DN9684_c0_g1_i5.p1 TRINITY_DN9684_c0_g1~~TRINITY_DN9684_c0_g1_i5.p1  ORF type:complete len:398 (+),score=100.83 TRINITY_DN9684_c0_g1_i5:963-2156(+)
MSTLVKSLAQDDAATKMQTMTIMSTLLENACALNKLPESSEIARELFAIIESANESCETATVKDAELVAFPSVEPKQEDRLTQCALKAFAALAASNEEIKSSAFELQHYKKILKLVNNVEPRIRAAACHCIGALVRVEKFPMRHFVSEGIVKAMQNLLYDKYLDVEIEAMGVLCSMAIELQKEICEASSCVKRIIDLMQSKYKDLRYRAIFLLKNLLFESPIEYRKQLLSMVTIERLMELFDDESTEIQAQAICAVRNITQDSENWASELFGKVGLEKMIQKVSEKLNSAIPEVALQALYLLSSMALAGDKCRSLIASSSLVQQCVAMLDSKNNKQTAIGAMNFVGAMLWKEQDAFLLAGRQKTFKELGAEDKLRELARSSCNEIKAKANKVLRHLN